MFQKSLDKFQEVSAEVESGTPLEDALKKHHMGAATYYAAKKLTAKGGKKARQKAKTAGPKGKNFVELPLKTTQSNVAVIVCQPDQIKNVLAGLQ